MKDWILWTLTILAAIALAWWVVNTPINYDLSEWMGK